MVKPGRCQPFRSPNNPPSLSTPRTLSGYLCKDAYQYKDRHRFLESPLYPLYPPTFPCTFHVVKFPLLSIYPRMPLGLLRVSDTTGRRLHQPARHGGSLQSSLSSRPILSSRDGFIGIGRSREKNLTCTTVITLF